MVNEYLFRNLVKRLLNDLDYLVADVRIHSPCGDNKNRNENEESTSLLLASSCIYV